MVKGNAGKEWRDEDKKIKKITGRNTRELCAESLGGEEKCEKRKKTQKREDKRSESKEERKRNS